MIVFAGGYYILSDVIPLAELLDIFGIFLSALLVV